jgi:hypothetical protein
VRASPRMSWPHASMLHSHGSKTLNPGEPPLMSPTSSGRTSYEPPVNRGPILGELNLSRTTEKFVAIRGWAVSTRGSHWPRMQSGGGLRMMTAR